ncbi:MAG: hypothetical protein C0617_12730, partial [Desulfuromonas sp.]
ELSPEKREEARSEAFDLLVDRGYKIRYALDEEIAVENSEVEEIFQEVKGRFSSLDDFQKALGGETVNEYRAAIYRSLLAVKAEKVAVDANVKVTDGDVVSYYEENKASFFRPKRFKVSHVLVKVPSNATNKERDEFLIKAEGLAERAKGGEDFYDLAYYNSDDRTRYIGGDLGFIHMGQTVKPFENALLNLKPGDVVGPVETISGFHIIKLFEVEDPTQLTLDEMRGKIQLRLKEKKTAALYEDWMKGLKAKYKAEKFFGE